MWGQRLDPRWGPGFATGRAALRGVRGAAAATHTVLFLSVLLPSVVPLPPQAFPNDRLQSLGVSLWILDSPRSRGSSRARPLASSSHFLSRLCRHSSSSFFCFLYSSGRQAAGCLRFLLHRWHVSGRHFRERNPSFQVLVKRRERSTEP